MKATPSPLRDPLLWAMMLAVAALLAGLSLARYQGFNSGILDLGAMAQAIFSVARGQPLVTTGANGNFSRLAGHVELIYFLFAPLTLLWRDPQVLLIGQALLAATGAIPAYQLALRRLERRSAARCAALIYLLYPVGMNAVLFDFHGDTLAMPLLMFALDALDRRAWRSFALWAGLALLCKLYVALPVLGMGAYLALWSRERRAGMIIVAAALAYGALLFFVVRERFAPPTLTSSAANTYANHYFGNLGEIPATLGPRLLNALIVVGPALLLAWRGWRWLLVGAPVALAALISTGPGGVYDYRYHHYATVVPFLVMAAIDGASRMRARAALVGPAAPRRSGRSWHADLVFTTIIVALISVLLVDTPLNPFFWLGLPGQGRDPSAYGITARDGVKQRFLAEHVPPHTPLAASMFLGAHLADRDTLYAVRYNDDPGGKRLPTILPQVDYLLADALFDWRVLGDGGVLGGIDYEQTEIGIALRDPAFGLIAMRDGLLLFARDAPAAERLPQEIAPIAAPTVAAPPLDFGPIQLLNATIAPQGGRRYQASFEWRLNGAQPERTAVAVSRLEGVEGARIVHLPSFALMPVAKWQPGQVMRESFVFDLPADLAPGRYRLLSGWYDAGSSAAYATDERSLLKASSEHETAIIEVGP